MTHTTASAAIDSWLASSLGKAVLQAESELMIEALDDVFGWELLQLGLWGQRESLLAGCRTRRHAIVANDGPRAADTDIGARLSQLPIANASVDAVLLPHTLEFETDPFAVVREADRVLAGEGHMLVLGFRPFSLWGFRSRAISRGYPPGLRRMLGARRVADWLELLGYDVGLTRNYLFTPPWGGSAPRPGETSALLRRGWIKPWPAGAYLLKARKRVYTLTPIRPRVRERAQPIGGLVKPTTPRQSS
ncbi:MAG TPA: methyltransferase domain-containing protein [Steroidobacteraceae bacterium]|nr:methyltransferase domain-containing protein [Steroidobacteraceae bacterium]